jgi:acyl-CoA dehydrogenase
MTTGSDDNADGMNFAVDDETELILDSLDEFIEREVEPLENELGETLTNPRLHNEPDGRVADEVIEAMETVRRKSAEAGFYAMNLPEEYGGGGVSNVTWYLAKKRVAQHGEGLAESTLAGPEGPKPLLTLAEGEQVEKYLEPAIQGKKSTAFAQTEPGVGSDSPNMSTTAERDGDEWVINGHKQWITNGPYADFAQVFARTTPKEEAGRYDGITCFIVEADEFEIGGYNNAVGREGVQAELLFDDVRVPDSRVLGSPDNAFRDAMAFLSLGRLEIGATSIGHTEFLLDHCIEYANDREAFGNPIGEFQQVSSKIARGIAKKEVADAFGLRCAWLMDQGENTAQASSILKWFATNTFSEVADDAVGIHGGNGLSEDNPFMDHLELARLLRIVEGTDEIQLNTIAKQAGVY